MTKILTTIATPSYWCSEIKKTPSQFLAKAMVLCMVVGCEKRSGHDKGIYFTHIASVVTNQGELEAEILSQQRRLRWISAISRAALINEILYND